MAVNRGPSQQIGKQRRPFAAELPGLEQRNSAIARRYKAGEDFASIGANLDLTRERVRQIIGSAGAACPREYKCAVSDCSSRHARPSDTATPTKAASTASAIRSAGISSSKTSTARGSTTRGRLPL